MPLTRLPTPFAAAAVPPSEERRAAQGHAGSTSWRARRVVFFMGLFLLDTAVGIRYLGIMKHAAGHDLTLDFSRMFRKSGRGPVETLSNIAVFVPFGFFLGE